MVALGERSARDARAHRGERLNRRNLAILGLILALGAGLRCWIATVHPGLSYDVQTVSIVAQAFSAHPLHVYSTLRYLYPGGYLPVLALVHWIAGATGGDLMEIFKVPAMLADLVIAGLVAWGLGRLGADARARLVAAALVALSPLFIGVSSAQGQIDAPAIVPAVVAVIIWQLGFAGRAWKAGLLVGLGGAIKWVPLFMVLAMLPTARSRKEAAVLIACAVSLPIASVLPFLIADWHHATESLTANKGLPGLGGLSIMIQPNLVHGWLNGIPTSPNDATSFFLREQNVIVAAPVVLTGLFAYLRRLDAITAAALIWLVLYVADPNWNYNYFVWGVPFFLLAGRWVEVAAGTALVSLAGADLFHIGLGHVDWLYILVMILIWAALATAAVLALRRILGSRQEASAI